MDLSYVCRGKQGHKVPAFLIVGARVLTGLMAEKPVRSDRSVTARARKVGRLYFLIAGGRANGGAGVWLFSYKIFRISSPNN